VPADLDAAKLAASVLAGDGLRELRAWIDARLVGPAGRPGEPSGREAEVVRLIALGYTSKEIAAHLGVSVKSVETYKTRAAEKLGLRGRREFVQYALRRGWLAVGGGPAPGHRPADPAA
jgi:DNA-binding CsgD family transcriptional regulator